LNSSILDTTASMGVQLARDKVMCAQILRRAGLPVPAHGLAGSLDQARAIAERLGYPVVIKPPALDGGVGVAAGLGSAADLDHAWSETARHGAQVLVEKHQPGEDFRLLVFDGRMVWAVGRQPAGVTGDGELCGVGALIVGDGVGEGDDWIEADVRVARICTVSPS
jgi:cyanophycin synthetase